MMLLKSIRLINIRSYKDESIEFPKGSLLLSGDIGSGKSTILLAIEFCLFGFRPKVLDGATLLRHGKKEGSIELRLEIDEKEIIITRILKRNKKGISQSSGYIIKEGKKKELTPIELKAEILDLLGYPKNILTKSKDLIYRYTVYTPQEDMKRIISEDPETRLDVLRKVFNMDKYSRIKENISIYIRVLKERSKILIGRSQGIEEIKQQKKERMNDIEELDIKISAKKPEHNIINKNLLDKKKNLESFENDLKKIAELNKRLEMQDVRLKIRIEQRLRNTKEIDNLSKIIEDTKVSAIDKDFEENLKKNIKTKEDILTYLETSIRKINEKIIGFRISKRNATEIKSKITSLENCPTCEQNVSDIYKKAIINREDAKIKNNEESIIIYVTQQKKTEEEMLKVKKDIEMFRKNLSSLDLMKMKIKRLNEDIRRKDNLVKEQDAIKLDIGKINKTKIELQKELSEFPDIEKLFKESKAEFDMILAQERKLALEINSLEKEKEGLLILIKSIDMQISDKEKAIENLKKIKSLMQWLEEYFQNVIGIIEKHILYSIYNEFNSLFREWFNILIEEDNLSVKLDDQFTPIITQNEYDANINNLSGGEKTSIALSYRLALNKVINDLISSIKTSDIIILDEPTDGFSSAQLDKVRDVLDQLDSRQILIVSHEPKIETFVDNSIRISKNEHVSKMTPS